MKTAKECLPKSIDSSPGYSSGRGATISDLDSDKLFLIYKNILDNIGFQASKNFVQMVKNIRVMSCTAFLQGLYILEKNDWKLKVEDVQDLDDLYWENEDEAYWCVASTIGKNPKKDDTLEIVGFFLKRFGEKHISLTNSDNTTDYNYLKNGKVY